MSPADAHNRPFTKVSRATLTNRNRHPHSVAMAAATSAGAAISSQKSLKYISETFNYDIIMLFQRERLSFRRQLSRSYVSHAIPRRFVINLRVRVKFIIIFISAMYAYSCEWFVIVYGIYVLYYKSFAFAFREKVFCILHYEKRCP